MAKKNAKASQKLTDIIIQGIREKKGLGIVRMDLRKVHSAFCDFFIVCHATSNRQVDSIAESVVDEVRKATGEKPAHVEGRQNAEWVLVDYADVVVHIFQEKLREHYAIEELWADAAVETIADI